MLSASLKPFFLTFLTRQQCEPLELRQYFHSLAGYPHQHGEVFSKFGRFPGRNAALGRPSTPEELDWLAQPDCPAWCRSQAATGASSDTRPPPHAEYPHVLPRLPAVYTEPPWDVAHIVARAVNAAETGLYCEAEQLFLRALTLSDTATEREMCAQVAMENDCPEAAIEHAVRATALRPTWPAAFVTLGRACRNAGVLTPWLCLCLQIVCFATFTPSFTRVVTAGKLGRASAAFATALSLLAGDNVSGRTWTSVFDSDESKTFNSYELILCRACWRRCGWSTWRYCSFCSVKGYQTRWRDGEVKGGLSVAVARVFVAWSSFTAGLPHLFRHYLRFIVFERR